MMNRNAVIIDGARLPSGRGGGALSRIPPEIFGGYLINKIVERSRIPRNEIDEVILGNVMGVYLCFARLCLLHAGLPESVPGVTLDRNCASGMQAIAFASQAIRCGEADLIIAGGVESMTRQPWTVEKPATSFPREPLTPRILSRMTAPKEFGEYNMGETAENVAERYQVSRKEQDELAVESHKRAYKAWEEGKFDEEVIPYDIPNTKGSPIRFERDETIRISNIEELSRLPTIFKKNGTVTAATSSPFTDGAAAVILTSYQKASDLGIDPIVRIIATASVGVDPAYMGMGPVEAVRKVLKISGLTMDKIGLIEINEAFASQVIACCKELHLNRNILNVNGSGISLGHAIAASGSRISTTLMYEMRRRETKYGLATMCVGGGQGTAIIYELV